MKVELISETTNYNFQHKINKFISRDDIKVIDIKYSPVCVSQREAAGNTVRNVDVIIHKALIMYEDKRETIDWKDI